jgi:dTDP-4-dehydrorhamnose 3,5-epimerase
MRTQPTHVPGLELVDLKRYSDRRGYVYELFSQARSPFFLKANFEQDNITWSAHAGTIRGLHYQKPPVAQAKLLTVLRGAVFDVAVDLRKGSPTYQQWTGTELSQDDARQLLIPEGLAHGFCTLVPDTMVMYKMTAPYSPNDEGGIAWNDATLAIEWPFAADRVILSDKDRALPSLLSLESPFQLSPKPS